LALFNVVRQIASASVQEKQQHQSTNEMIVSSSLLLDTAQNKESTVIYKFS